MTALYTTSARATGDGRNGHARSDDGRLDLDLAKPVEMSGTGEGTNPEQLFAAGYGACFHQALLGAAARKRVHLPTSTAVEVHVALVAAGRGRFRLEIDLQAELPGVPAADAEAIVALAHEVCPYSNALRANCSVTVSVSQEREVIPDHATSGAVELPAHG